MTQKNPKKQKPKLTDEQAFAMGEALFEALGSERVADLVCTGLECGSYATFGVMTDKYVKPEVVWSEGDSWPVEKPFRHVQYPLSEGGAATLYCRYDEEEGTPERDFRLDLPALKRGLARLMLQHPRLYGEILSENYDALGGDAYLQCCLLGEVVYG